jgi:hypothetical protein
MSHLLLLAAGILCIGGLGRVGFRYLKKAKGAGSATSKVFNELYGFDPNMNRKEAFEILGLE